MAPPYIGRRRLLWSAVRALVPLPRSSRALGTPCPSGSTDCDPALPLEQRLFRPTGCENRRKCVDVAGADEDLSRFRAFRRTDDAILLEYLHEPHGTRMSDLELRLQKCDARHLPFDDDLRRFESELVRRTGAIFFELVDFELDAVPRIVLGAPELAEPFDLGGRHERALHAGGLRGIHRQEEHV